jgi:4-amino-4-deoxy-L-arabinose transferase-like glycosyltransferase
MSSKTKFRLLLFILVAVCIIVRLVFVFAAEQIPVMWDARLYSSAAIGMIYYFQNPGRFGRPELDSPADQAFSQSQFEHTTKEYIEGEQIRWLYYEVPTIAKAQGYIFISGPVFPLFLAAIFAFDVGGDFTTVRTFNVLVDALCLLLVMLIATRLFGRREAVLAAIIYIFYLPFIIYTGFISPEPLTVLFILLTYYLILRWYERPKLTYIYLCGLLLGLLVLTRPTAALLFVPFFLGFLYDNRMKWINALRSAAPAILPFFIIILPWTVFASLYFGQLSIRDPDYSEANLRSSSSIIYEGYDLDYVDPDFWTASVSYSIISNPLGYGKLLLKKFVRLWSQPYNDYKQSFILTPTSGHALHVPVVLSALFGIFLFAIQSRKGLIYLFLIPLYYTLIHVIFHSLARYNLSAMPLMIIISSAVLIRVYDYGRELVSGKAAGAFLARFAIFIIGGLFVLFFPEQLLIDLLGVYTGVELTAGLKLLVLLALLVYLFKIVSRKTGSMAALKISGIPAALLLALLVFLGRSPDSWAEWTCRLENSRQAAASVIYFPRDFRLSPGELAGIEIDMVGNKGRKNPFHVAVNGLRHSFHFDRPPVSSFFYRKTTYDVFGSLLDLGQEEIRTWRFIPIEAGVVNSLLDKDGFIEIMISAGDSVDEKGNFISLYGNCQGADRKKVLIPSLSHHSIERFIEKGDPRIWMDYKLSSDSVISYYIEDIERPRLNTEDLSPSGGRQSGRYRIYLEVIRLDKSRLYF